jgi:hypothetical protein
MSVILNGQAEINLSPICAGTNVENIIDNCFQIEDNCEEDLLIIEKGTEVQLTEEQYLFRMLRLHTIIIPLFHWNPPK